MNISFTTFFFTKETGEGEGLCFNCAVKRVIKGERVEIHTEDYNPPLFCEDCGHRLLKTTL